MAEPVTILIPDISGYTEFLSKTDVEHGAYIMNHLLEAIVQSMDPNFVVAEIEGDAVLLYRKGPPPGKKEITDQCIKTFSIFKNNVRNIKDIVICQCTACQDVIDLSLKFVVHYGNIAEINVNRFVKATGLDMVIAHRLLKNSIPEHEYVLATDSYLKNISDAEEEDSLTWTDAKDDYPSIGSIEYRFASLASVMAPQEIIPEEAPAIKEVTGISTSVDINVPYRAILEPIITMEKRKQYIDDLPEGEGPPRLHKGAHYYYSFEKGRAEITPYHLVTKEREIVYEEYLSFPAIHFYAGYQFRIEALSDSESRLTWTVFPQPGHTFSDEMQKWIAEKITSTATRFKTYCEKNFRESLIRANDQ